MLRMFLAENAELGVDNRFSLTKSLISGRKYNVTVYLKDIVNGSSSIWDAGDIIDINDEDYNGIFINIVLPFTADLSKPADSSSVALAEFIREGFSSAFGTTTKAFDYTHNIWSLNFMIEHPYWFLGVINVGGMENYIEI
ncbi:hypothetical protein [Seleniivibrio woodruffii]|uniref:hypothetical protein n=1 Tax=Seleniivibrio woodruffii TaxID=1078050 RepID=UPI00240969E1|nr:hypothetical protein [Seleniivibrio woodruffii]